MKQTEKWLPIAQKKAQSELTFARQQIRAIDAFQSINHLPELNEPRRSISDKIRSMRYWLKGERHKAFLRGDLEKYRPSSPKKENLKLVPLTNNSPTPAEQRELLLVG